MRFLFINPRRTIDRKNIWNVINSISPPIGLAMLAAVLEQAGNETAIIDANALDLDRGETLSRIDPAADAIGLSATTPEIEEVVALCREIRSRRRNVMIMLGGVHPTVFHEQLVRDGTCDLVVRGEGEQTVLAIAQGRQLAHIPGLTWRSSDGAVVVNPPGETYADLNTLPLPAYHRLPMKAYRSALGAAKRSPSLGMITSRGCPGTCTFCYSGMFGTKIRYASPERILEHILFLKRTYGVREISFYDDTFTANRKRVEALCSLMISERVNMTWSCFARADTVDAPLLAMMKRAGCHQVGYGFESSDENILKAINKKINTSKIEHAVTLMKAAGIDIRGAFMIGNPGETDESIRKTIDYSVRLGIQYAMYNITTPFPGTQLFAWAEQNGLLGHTVWGKYDLAHPVLMLPTVSSSVVEESYRRAYRRFYLRPSYVAERLFAIRSWDDVKIYLNALRGILSVSRQKVRRDLS